MDISLLLEELRGCDGELSISVEDDTSVGLIYKADDSFFSHRLKSQRSRYQRQRDSFEIRTLIGKGEGVVSLTLIPQFTALLSHIQPILFFPAFLNLKSYAEPLFRHLVSLLSQTVQTSFSHLANSYTSIHPNVNDSNVHSLDGIGEYFGRILTNGFVIKLPCPSTQDYFFVFPKPISSFNHSCAPNLVWNFDLDTLTQNVTTISTIREGEELCFSYLDERISRRNRLEIIRDKWGFECDCWSCEEENKERGNEGRRQLMMLSKSIISSSTKTNTKGKKHWLEDLLGCERALKILKNERIWKGQEEWLLRRWSLMRKYFGVTSDKTRDSLKDYMIVHRIEYLGANDKFTTNPDVLQIEQQEGEESYNLQQQLLFPRQVYEAAFTSHLTAERTITPTSPRIDRLRILTVGGDPLAFYVIHFSESNSNSKYFYKSNSNQERWIALFNPDIEVRTVVERVMEELPIKMGQPKVLMEGPRDGKEKRDGFYVFKRAKSFLNLGVGVDLDTGTNVKFVNVNCANGKQTVVVVF